MWRAGNTRDDYELWTLNYRSLNEKKKNTKTPQRVANLVWETSTPSPPLNSGRTLYERAPPVLNYKVFPTSLV